MCRCSSSMAPPTAWSILAARSSSAVPPRATSAGSSPTATATTRSSTTRCASRWCATSSGGSTRWWCCRVEVGSGGRQALGHAAGRWHCRGSLRSDSTTSRGLALGPTRAAETRPDPRTSAMRWPGARQRLLVLLLCLNAALPLIYLSVSRIAISDPATGGWLGDTGSYIHMYDGVPLDSIPKPFRYRILAPYLARLVPPLPASIASLYQITPDKLIKFRFGAVDFLGLTGAAYFTFLLCETLGFAAAECMIASLLFMTGFPVVNFAGLPLTDAVSYFFLVAAIVCVLRDWDLGLLVMVAVGMLAKETTAFVLVPILALELPLAARLRKLLL